jgi:hypothetical protein
MPVGGMHSTGVVAVLSDSSAEPTLGWGQSRTSAAAQLDAKRPK